jgi:hypothetical protein
MKNGFELINTVRAWCHANHRLMTDVHYSLKDQCAIFVAEKLYEESDNRFALLRWTEQNGIEVCKWYLSKSQALKMLIEQYDEIQGGASC